MKKDSHSKISKYDIIQKINRRVAYRLRRWEHYSSGMFTFMQYDDINDAFEELCVLYKTSGLLDIPFGESMLDVISDMQDEVCRKLSKRERQILYNATKKFCPCLEESRCSATDCAGCCIFRKDLLDEFEDYLTNYYNAKIEKAVWG